MEDTLNTPSTVHPLVLQQLRELTSTEVGDFNALNYTNLLARYRAQYTRGWNAARDDLNVAIVTEAVNHGYGDYTVGLPKWAALAETGILG